MQTSIYLLISILIQKHNLGFQKPKVVIWCSKTVRDKYMCCPCYRKVILGSKNELYKKCNAVFKKESLRKKKWKPPA